jgi:Skp family chaperone for outer membrane proteins
MSTNNLQQLVTEYMDQLSDIERKACAIAKDHLGSSFNIVKSNGFNDWSKERAKEKERSKEKISEKTSTTCAAASS